MPPQLPSPGSGGGVHPPCQLHRGQGQPNPPPGVSPPPRLPVLSQEPSLPWSPAAARWQWLLGPVVPGGGGTWAAGGGLRAHGGGALLGPAGCWLAFAGGACNAWGWSGALGLGVPPPLPEGLCPPRRAAPPYLSVLWDVNKAEFNLCRAWLLSPLYPLTAPWAPCAQPGCTPPPPPHYATPQPHLAPRVCPAPHSPCRHPVVHPISALACTPFPTLSRPVCPPPPHHSPCAPPPPSPSVPRIPPAMPPIPTPSSPSPEPPSQLPLRLPGSLTPPPPHSRIYGCPPPPPQGHPLSPQPRGNARLCHAAQALLAGEAAGWAGGGHKIWLWG